MRQDAETGDAESRGAGQSRFPPPTEYLYPFGDEPGQITAEIALSFGPGTDLSAARIEIPPLKYNKSLLLLLTQDDCKQAAFSTTWAAINGRPLSDTYFYNAPHLRGGDMPPDTYSFGKALGSTDGTGREVRFSFTTAISPEWDYMDDKAVEGYDPIQTIFLQSGGEKLRPFAVNGDLLRTRIERGLWLPAAIPAVIEAQMARPVEEREAVNIGVHGTDRFWSEMLLWLNNTYGRKRAGDGKHAHADGRDARRTLFLLSFADDQSSGRRSRSLHGGRRR